MAVGIRDEVAFAIKSKEWTWGKKASFAPGEERKLAACLSYLDSEISEKAFSFLELDTKKVAAYAKAACAGKKGTKGLADIFTNIKQGEHKARLLDACDEKLVPLAEQYFLKKAAEETGVPTRPGGKADMKDESGDEQAAFIGKFGEWFSAKKMSIDAGTKRHEIAGILANIDVTLRRKMFDFTGISEEAIEARALQLTKGRRKAYGNLVDALREVREDEAMGDAGAYLFDRILSNLGFCAWLGIAELGKVYPELKFAKPKGNFGKKKKRG